MASSNRCAVVLPAPILLALWPSPALDLDTTRGGAREPCLYLIPRFRDETTKPKRFLKEIYEAIFEAGSSTSGIATAGTCRRSTPIRCFASGLMVAF